MPRLLFGRTFVAFCVLGNFRLASPQFLTEVPVIRFFSEDSSFTIDSPNITLRWFIQPSVATLFWLRCYHDGTKNGNKHFYTFDQNRVKTSRIGELGSRTNHTFNAKEQSKVFALNISPALITDRGNYTCELEAPGNPQNRVASLKLNLRDFKPTQTPRLTDPETTATVNVTKPSILSSREQSGSRRLTIGLAIVITTFLIMVCGIGVFVLYKRLQKSQPHCARKEEEQVLRPDNLQTDKRRQNGNGRLLTYNHTGG